MKSKHKKLTTLDMVSKILDSELPISTKNEIVRHYLLPKLGQTLAPVQMKTSGVSAVGRPSAEEIEIENNPKLKGEYRETTKLMNKAK